jgi:hypothetical protein
MLTVVVVVILGLAASHALPTRNYLLADNNTRLEPCTASQVPRAWRSSRQPAAALGFQLPGTEAMQLHIFKHQHPADCSKAKFLVYQPPLTLGLGATIDHIADALGWALSEDRVLILDYPSPWTKCVYVEVPCTSTTLSHLCNAM